VAPDGALFVTDWYDPLTGGHAMGDPQGAHGRIYRLAAGKNKPGGPKGGLDTPQGVKAAVRAPAQAGLCLPFPKIQSQGAAAVPLLESMWRQKDPVLKARALWILSGFGTQGARAVREASQDADPRFRVLALRVLRSHGTDLSPTIEALLHDKSPQV